MNDDKWVMVPVEPTPEWVANLIQVRIDRMESVIEDVLAAAPAVQGEPVAWSGWGCQYPGKMPRLYGDRRIAELNCDRENGDQLLHFTAAPQPAVQSFKSDIAETEKERRLERDIGRKPLLNAQRESDYGN